MTRIRNLLPALLFAVVSGAGAEVLPVPPFQLEIQDGWIHNTDAPGPGGGHFGEQLNIYHPNGIGTLRLRSFDARQAVSRERLRLMTNVDASKDLPWQQWGDVQGYQYDYLEAGAYYRQWWLAHENSIIFVTYESRIGPTNSELAEIDDIVRSISINPT